MTTQELQDILDGISLARHREHEPYVAKDGRTIIIPGWGFELVLTISDSGSIIGHVSDTSGG